MARRPLGLRHSAARGVPAAWVRGCVWGGANASEYLLARAEGDRLSFVKHERHVQCGNHAWAMRYHDNDALVAAQNLNGTAQRVLAVGIQVRVGLVEYD